MSIAFLSFEHSIGISVLGLSLGFLGRGANVI